MHLETGLPCSKCIFRNWELLYISWQQHHPFSCSWIYSSKSGHRDCKTWCDLLILMLGKIIMSENSSVCQLTRVLDSQPSFRAPTKKKQVKPKTPNLLGCCYRMPIINTWGFSYMKFKIKSFFFFLFSPVRRGWGNWACSAWRREGCEGT